MGGGHLMGRMDELNLQEKAPPGFPTKLHDKLLNQYKDNPSKAYATMWKLHKKYGDKLEEAIESHSTLSKDDIIRKLNDENEKLKAGIESVESLINESEGVVGLHLNGDVAPWKDLLQGGRYEGWLLHFSDALNLL